MKNPIYDFGTCKEKIQGKTHRVQVWTYHDSKTNTDHTLKDPDNHYWIHFTTITGEKITFGCSSSSFGMEVFVDAEPLVLKMGCTHFSLSNQLPTILRGPQEHRPDSCTPIEEQRFSVMRNIMQTA
ncbi:hypothetical protein AN958_12037 [Leucoagaricus sp. SymC.cos]|nr:hypothetical protein AN958_12037 [Leucoagaricus sp. SymC.cos]